MHHRHACSVIGAKGNGVQQLRRQQNRQRADAPGDHQQSHEGTPETEQQDLVQAIDAQQTRQQHEQADFRDHPQRPQPAHRGFRVTGLDQVNRVESVIRPVRHLHQEKPGHQGQHVRARKNSKYGCVPGVLRRSAVAWQQKSAGRHQHQRHEHHRRECPNAEVIERITGRDHHGDETDRTP